MYMVYLYVHGVHVCIWNTYMYTVYICVPAIYIIHIVCYIHSIYSIVYYSIYEVNGHKLEQTPRDNRGQRSLAGYNPWSHKESDTTYQPNNNHT